MENRILDDLAKVAAGAGRRVGAEAGDGARMRQQFERVLAAWRWSAGRVRAVKAMAALARRSRKSWREIGRPGARLEPARTSQPRACRQGRG